MDRYESELERVALLLSEHFEAVIIVGTRVDEDGETYTYEASRGNAHAIEGMIYAITQDQDEESEPSEFD
ncbi:MAG: hypothetical protein MJH10_12310 [Epibacterium sp.]|nr:hypothetical protein [Epibacterium sp.]NQX74332.1 hypothetical protein [Epibacterium sp.]